MIGSWAAAYTATNDTEDVLGFFETAMGASSGGDLRSNNILYDLILHALKTIVVVATALSEAGMAWSYVYYQMV
jgi:hypothetical protein